MSGGVATRRCNYVLESRSRRLRAICIALRTDMRAALMSSPRTRLGFLDKTGAVDRALDFTPHALGLFGLLPAQVVPGGLHPARAWAFSFVPKLGDSGSALVSSCSAAPSTPTGPPSSPLSGQALMKSAGVIFNISSQICWTLGDIPSAVLRPILFASSKSTICL